MIIGFLQKHESLQQTPGIYPVKDQQESREPRKAVLGLEAIVTIVRVAVSEISGAEVDEDAHFSDHHFDSLSAVELASTIGKAVGLTLPSTRLLFAVGLLQVMLL